MSESAMWIIPEAPPPADVSVTRGRKVQGGLRLGILDNSKSNADHLLAMIVDGIKAQLPVVSVMTLRKPGPAAGADPKVLDQLAEEADCVISAMAD
jgi:uncharacterized protein YhfF